MNINQAASSQDAETATEMMDAFWRVVSSKRSDKRTLQVDNTNLPQKLTINQHQDNRGEHKLIASCLNLRTNIIIRMVWSKTKATEFISFHQSFLVANPQWRPLRAEQADISFHFISQSHDSRPSEPSSEKKKQTANFPTGKLTQGKERSIKPHERWAALLPVVTSYVNIKKERMGIIFSSGN